MSISRRKFLITASSATTVASPLVFTSTANANPLLLFQQILAGAFRAALTNMGRKRIVSSVLRGQFQKQIQRARSGGFRKFVDEFQGEFVDALFENASEELFAISGTAINSDPARFSNALSLGLIKGNKQFISARNDYLNSSRGRRLPGNSFSPANLNMVEIEVLALRYAVSARKKERWSKSKIARCYTPIGARRNHIPAGNDPYIRKQTGNYPELVPHYYIQTPTGTISVDGEIDRVSGRVDFEIKMHANPDLTFCGSSLDCPDVQIKRRDRFRGKIKDFG